MLPTLVSCGGPNFLSQGTEQKRQKFLLSEKVSNVECTERIVFCVNNSIPIQSDGPDSRFEIVTLCSHHHRMRVIAGKVTDNFLKFTLPLVVDHVMRDVLLKSSGRQ